MTDGEPLPFRTIVSRMIASQGVTPPTGEVPLWLMWAYANVLEAGANVFGYRPRLTRMAVALLSGEMTVVDAKARRKLGYRGHKTVEDGLRELAEDYERSRTSAAGTAGTASVSAAAAAPPGASGGAGAGAAPAPSPPAITVGAGTSST